VVIQDVPPQATVVGVPGKIRRRPSDAARQALDHGNLPDPTAELIRSLSEELERLEARIEELERTKPSKLRPTGQA
jgi:serine O-acetyltransferase